LAGLLADRIAALPESARDALALAGIGAEGNFESLAAAYGPHLRRDLLPALDADLVSLDAEHVRFTHPLIATAAEAGVSSQRRAELHRRLAGVARSPEVRAAHLAEAAEAPDTAVAEALEDAARATRRRGARAASASLFEGAARLTPASEALGRDRRFLAAAEGWYEAGDGGHAEEILTALLGHLPRGEQRCEAAWRLGILRDEAGRWKEAIDLWRAALADTDDPRLESRIRGSLAITAFYTGSVADANEMAATAVAAAERAADPAHLARALAVQALTLAMNGGTGQQPIIDRALALEAGIDESLGDWSPSGIAAECARHTGDTEAAGRHYAAVLERAVEAGDANQEQWAAFGLASTLLMTGAYRRASELADTVLDIADQTGQMGIPAKSLRAHVDAYLGDLDAARRLVEQAIDGAKAADEATHLFGANVVLALIEVFAGRTEAALAAFAEARRIAVEVGLAHATALRAFINEAEAAALAGRLDQAEAALAAFDATVNGQPPPWSTSILHRARGAILAARGLLDDAQDELSRALAADGVLPFDRGRTLLAIGTVARRRRAYSQARDALGQALEVFTALGTRPWVERAQQELGRIPGRRSGRHDELTEAEVRIATLVAAGRSNKEVAAALFVSVKTVEGTLTRVYEKVRVRSRAELAHHFGAAAKR
jgi:DNA-binding CsgD family transcriptional regulator